MQQMTCHLCPTFCEEQLSHKVASTECMKVVWKRKIQWHIPLQGGEIQTHNNTTRVDQCQKTITTRDLAPKAKVFHFHCCYRHTPWQARGACQLSGGVAHFMGRWPFPWGGGLTLVFTWLMGTASGGWHPWGGGHLQVLSSLNHGLLQHYFAPFWKAAKWQECLSALSLPFTHSGEWGGTPQWAGSLTWMGHQWGGYGVHPWTDAQTHGLPDRNSYSHLHAPE